MSFYGRMLSSSVRVEWLCHVVDGCLNVYESANCLTNSVIILHNHWQWMNIPGALHPYQSFKFQTFILM